MQPRIMIVGHVIATPQVATSKNNKQYAILKVRSEWSYNDYQGNRQDNHGVYDILFGEKKCQEISSFSTGCNVIVECSLNSNKKTLDNGSEFYNLSLSGISIEKIFLKHVTDPNSNYSIPPQNQGQPQPQTTNRAMEYAKQQFNSDQAFTNSDDIPF